VTPVRKARPGLRARQVRKDRQGRKGRREAHHWRRSTALRARASTQRPERSMSS
jgi:hypothetical protein